MERDGVRAQEIVTGGIVPRSFYERGAVPVARDLLGKILVHGLTSGIIVETEAYLGGDDLASHSAAGITDRTRVIFGPAGHAYVYLSYGMHDCLNIVAEPAGMPGCVLIRALEPVEGLDLMRSRRPKARKDRDLTSGPGKLTRALGITRKHTGVDMTAGDLVVRAQTETPRFDIAVTPRIGITKCADLPLRFFMKGNRFVSVQRIRAT
jgi:DNA-3-methyladenine glycosylase